MTRDVKVRVYFFVYHNIDIMSEHWNGRNFSILAIENGHMVKNTVDCIVVFKTAWLTLSDNYITLIGNIKLVKWLNYGIVVY